SRRRHTRSKRDWSSDVCSSDLIASRARNRAVACIPHRARDDLMARKKSGSGTAVVFLVAAIIIIWLFAFGGIMFLQGLFVPSSGGAPASTFSAQINSISDGGHATTVAISDPHHGTIADTKA